MARSYVSLARPPGNQKARLRLFLAWNIETSNIHVVQGIERGVWKWSVSVEGMIVAGQEQTRPEAIAAAEKAIDRAISLKKVRTRSASNWRVREHRDFGGGLF